jgi:hypothetical protein
MQEPWIRFLDESEINRIWIFDFFVLIVVVNFIILLAIILTLSNGLHDPRDQGGRSKSQRKTVQR